MKTTNNQKPPAFSNEQPPKLIYKYQDCTTQSLENLKSQVIYFSDHKNFNDPHDCRFKLNFSELGSADIKQVRDIYLNDPSKKVQDAATQRNDIALEEYFSATVKLDIEAKIDGKVQGVACFSETHNNPLMWGHYGAKAKGFCLEFKTNCDLLKGLRKVKYAKSRLNFQPLPLILGDDDNLINKFVTSIFCTKQDSWSCEKEWRVLGKAVMTYPYPPEALNGIYFGPNIDDKAIEVIYSIVKNQNPEVHFYKGKLGDDFEIKFDKFDYTSYEEAKRRGSRDQLAAK